jgi:hypothetical protein
MENKKLMKVLSIVLPIGGAIIGLVNSWFDDKKLDEKIAEKVAKAMETDK